MSDNIYFHKCYKSITKYLGPEASILLAELLYEQDYYKEKNQLNKYGYFTSTVDNIANATGLLKRKQITAISKLEQYEIIDKYTHGQEKDTRRYFRVDRMKLKAFDEYCMSLGNSPLIYDEYVDYIQVGVMTGKYNGTNCTNNGTKKSIFNNNNGTKCTNNGTKKSIFNNNNGTKCTNIQNNLNHYMEQNEPYYGTKCSTNKIIDNIDSDKINESSSSVLDDGWDF